MLRKFWSTVCVGLLALCATAQAQSSTDRQLPTNRMLSRYGLERAWWSQATMNVGRDKVAHLALDEENLYVQSTGGTITAFDSESGTKRWFVQLGVPDAPSYAPTSNDELVLINAGSAMYALNKRSGKELWNITLPAPPATSAAIDRNHVYYGTLDGSIYCFDLKQIQKLHRDNRLPQWSNVALKWRFKTAEQVTSVPLLAGGVLNFASRDKSLYAINKGDRKMQWQFETKKAISAPLARADGLIFMGTEDLNLFCIGQERGTVKWQFVAGLPIRRQAHIVENSVYVFPENGGVYSLSKQIGTPQWWQAGIRDFVGSMGSSLLTTDDLGNLTVLNRPNGAVVGSLPLRDFSVRYGNDLTDRAYVATTTGLVVCIRQVGKEFPSYHLYPDRQPLLPEFEPDEPAADANAM